MTAREVAFLALRAYWKRGARPDIILSKEAKTAKLDRRDTALASNILNGVLQNTALCDHYIGCFLKNKNIKMDAEVRDILRVAVYQIFFLTRIPSHAAVSEGVELAKKYAPKASGFVNAVLRAAASAKEAPTVDITDGAERLSILYSHPEWLVKLLCDDYGRETAELILSANNMPAPVTAQVNTLKCTADKAKKNLEADGAEVKDCPGLEHTLLLSGTGAIDELSAFKNGIFYIQDISANLAVEAMGLEPGMTVIDCCSAPGGKSFAAAVKMKNQGSILSMDIHEKKLSQISKGAERLGIDIISTAARDGRNADDRLFGTADAVICDVPCSGIGVIRKKPEIRFKDENDIQNLPGIQLDILKSAANYVKPGGVLLYSTCTILKRENEDVIKKALLELSDFTPEAFTLPAPFGEVSTGILTILPHTADTDGFFICKLRRKSDKNEI